MTLTTGAAVLVSVVCGALGGVGVTLAVGHWLPESAKDGVPSSMSGRVQPTREPESPPPAPMLTASPGAAERGLQDLRAKLDAQEARLARLDAFLERLEAAGVLEHLPQAFDPKEEPAKAESGAVSRRRREAHESLAKEVGLKGDRAKAFVEFVGDVTKRLAEVERQHAKKSVDGDTTTITIEGHAADNDRLRGELETWVGRNLEAGERDRLAESGEYAVMLHRLGSQPRAITVRTAEGQVLLRDEVRGTPGESGAMSLEVGGPAGLKDVLLSDYAHLLR